MRTTFKKSFILILLSTMATLLLVGVLSACGGEKDDGAYNSFITYSVAYTDETECPDGNINDSLLQKERAFAVSTINYAVIDFTLDNPRQNGWGDEENFFVNVAFTPASVLSVTLNQAATGNFTERVEVDTMHLTLSYRIPESSVKSKSYRLVVQFSADRNTMAEIDLSFYSEKENKDAAYVSDHHLDIGHLKSSIMCSGTTLYELSLSPVNTDAVCQIPNYYNGVKVTRIHEHSFSNCGWLKSVTIGNNITTIEDSAFYFCTNLTEITIGNGVKNIGDGAFYDTGYYYGKNWENGVLYIGNYLIYAYSTPDSYSIKDGTLAIADYAFSECYNLNSITIPESVKSIGYSAFKNTAYYKDENNWENDLLYIGKYLIGAKQTLSGTCTIKDGTLAIADYAFCEKERNETIFDYVGCENLTEVIIPDSVSHIGYHAFHSCNNLANVKLGSGVTGIGDYAFCNCTNLTNIEIPDSVTTLGDWAFEECENLKSATIGSGVSILGSSLFFDCDNLESVVIRGNITYISDSALACKKLSTITYSGTKANWNAIKKDEYWNAIDYWDRRRYKIICSDGNI